jgi:hypothetical protein
MPVRIEDLRPGDRVILNCPKARRLPRREVEFCGVITPDEAIERINRSVVRDFDDAAMDRQARYAEFLFGFAGPDQAVAFVQRDGRRHLIPPGRPTRHCCALRIADDGTLKDDEGRTVFIERRVPRAAHG